MIAEKEGRRFVVVHEGMRVFTLMGRFATSMRRARPRPNARVPAFAVAGGAVSIYTYCGWWLMGWYCSRSRGYLQ